jgi:hypothetical protein
MVSQKHDHDYVLHGYHQFVSDSVELNSVLVQGFGYKKTIYLNCKVNKGIQVLMKA